jgi:hypothetical protein
MAKSQLKQQLLRGSKLPFHDIESQELMDKYFREVKAYAENKHISNNYLKGNLLRKVRINYQFFKFQEIEKENLERIDISKEAQVKSEEFSYIWNLLDT